MTTFITPKARLHTNEEWVTDAACQDTDPEVFFAIADTVMEDYAKTICRRCPVQRDCLEYAIDRGELGVWGGTNEKDRRRMVNNRLAAARRVAA